MIGPDTAVERLLIGVSLETAPSWLLQAWKAGAVQGNHYGAFLAHPSAFLDWVMAGDWPDVTKRLVQAACLRKIMQELDMA